MPPRSAAARIYPCRYAIILPRVVTRSVRDTARFIARAFHPPHRTIHPSPIHPSFEPCDGYAARGCYAICAQHARAAAQKEILRSLRRAMRHAPRTARERMRPVLPQRASA